MARKAAKASMPTSTPAISEARRRRSGGFTLIELAVVLLILAVLLSFVTPRLMTLGQARREASARRLATLLGYLHDEASLRGRTYRLTLDFDEGRYEVRTTAESRDPATDDDFVEEWGPLARDESLPEGVRIAAVETPTLLASSGTVDLFFHPESDEPGAKITLADEAGGSSLLVFDGVTGHVYIVDTAGTTPSPPTERRRGP
jgi:prepilin-type N-terminal cleavage/methylation domain-containing protein